MLLSLLFIYKTNVRHKATTSQEKGGDPAGVVVHTGQLTLSRSTMSDGSFHHPKVKSIWKSFDNKNAFDFGQTTRKSSNSTRYFRDPIQPDTDPCTDMLNLHDVPFVPTGISYYVTGYISTFDTTSLEIGQSSWVLIFFRLGARRRKEEADDDPVDLPTRMAHCHHRQQGIQHVYHHQVRIEKNATSSAKRNKDGPDTTPGSWL